MTAKFNMNIDTPALLLRMDVVEKNIAKMADFFSDKPCELRPHIKTHKLPLIAHKQIEAGAIGLTCATITEAETFIDAGFNDILIANEIADETKIEKLARLSGNGDIIVCVDNYDNACDISRAAKKHKAMPGILIDINVGLNRCGVAPGQAALELARKITRLENIRLRGIMGYEGAFFDCRIEEVEQKCGKANKLLVETKNLLEANGFPVEFVSAGGTQTYRITGTYPGITDVQAGAYATMDVLNMSREADFNPAMTVLATVISRPERTRAIIDAGMKSLSVAAEMPIVNEKGVVLYKLNEEHSYLRIEDPDNNNITVGAKVEIIPWRGSMIAPLFQRYHVIRENNLESIIKFRQNH